MYNRRRLYEDMTGAANMKYVKTGEDPSGVSYLVFKGQEHVGDFSYEIKGHTGEKHSSYRDRAKQFWIRQIHLRDAFLFYDLLNAILHFLQYKCMVCGCSAMYLRLNTRNLLMLEMFQKFGFYMISEDSREIKKGVAVYEYVMKYNLPGTLEEAYRLYIRRK